MKLHRFTFRVEEQITVAAPDDTPDWDVFQLVKREKHRLLDLGEHLRLQADGSDSGIPEDVTDTVWVVSDNAKNLYENEETDWLAAEIAVCKAEG